MINSKRWVKAALNWHRGPFVLLYSCIMWQQPSGQPWTPVNGSCMSALSLWGVSGWERRMQHLGSRGRGGHDEFYFGFDSILVCSGVSSVWHGCPWEGLWSVTVVRWCRQTLVIECFRSAGCQGVWSRQVSVRDCWEKSWALQSPPSLAAFSTHWFSLSFTVVLPCFILPRFTHSFSYHLWQRRH